MASGVKLEVIWSPVHQDKFITWGSDLSLYEVAPLSDSQNKPACIKLSEWTGAHLVASSSNHSYVKCVDIYPQEGSDLLLALGHADGKVLLTTFGPTNFDSLGISGKELVPRQARQCNSVAWNHADPNIIAVALDKYRNDHCILLWDVMKCATTNDGSSSPGASSVSGSGSEWMAAKAVELPRPIAEMGLSEVAHSLAWPQRQPRTLIVGMNQKQIKIFDLRDFSNKAVSMTSSKCVYGVCVDALNEHQMASYADSTVCVWDVRCFERPLLTLQQPKPVTIIRWCPTRRNLLCSLQKDSSSLRLHDVQNAPPMQYYNTSTAEVCGSLTPGALERSIMQGSSHIISSFSWHPRDEGRLATIALSGVVTDYTVSKRITLNWGPGGGLVWSRGHRTLHTLPAHFYSKLDDISSVIKRRANTDYGLKSELWQNGDLAESDQLKNLWHWLFLSRSLVEEGCIRGMASKHPGVKSVLQLDVSGTVAVYRSETVDATLPDSGNLRNTTYRSEERERALQLCGWCVDKETGALAAFLERLEADGQFARAAAIATFHLKLRQAIHILNRAADKVGATELGVVGLALAGYSEGGLWQQLCSSTRPKLSDPHLRALFAFLAADDGNYDAVLNESEISVEDRVAFACMFLPDTKLADYIRHVTAKLVMEGDLSGILLTGMSLDGATLLQQYVDWSADVQSAALVAARAFTPALLKETSAQHWIESYRSLLDSWRYWEQRAMFDIALCAGAPPPPASSAPYAPRGVSKPPQQVYISCNYCGKTISAYTQGLARTRGTFARIVTTSNKLKQISSCPNCRKPLPRCTVCMLHMGTAGGASSPPAPPPTPPAIDAPAPPASPNTGDFPCWFSWCQSCRHGGHSQHMLHWFREHAECPVTCCTCKCLTLDMAMDTNHI